MRLPVLMFHQIAPAGTRASGLTIDVDRLKSHFEYLKDEGYCPIHFKDLSLMHELPQKPVIITFDDVYVNQLDLGYPLLQNFGFKACFYIPFKYVGGVNAWDQGKERIMSIDDLKSIDQATIELGFHSFAHGRFDQMSLEEIRVDFILCSDFIRSNQLDVSPVIAYPYGKFPRKGEANVHFINLLKEFNISYGLRIGNRLNKLPLKNTFEIQRIDIRGEFTDWDFRRKLRYGRFWF